MKKPLPGIFLSLLFSLNLYAQCDILYEPRASQDCPGAIQVCSRNLNFTDSTICGEGNLSAELGTTSCLSGREVHTVWFTFKTYTAGKVKFVLTPFDTGQDIDFAVVRLNGQPNSSSVCSLIGTSGQVPASCNYSSFKGATGVWDSTFAGLAGAAGDSTQDSLGTRVNKPFTAQAGETFVLMVNLRNSVNTGFNLRFANPGPNIASVGKYKQDIIAQTPDSLAAPGGNNYHWYVNGTLLPDSDATIFAPYTGRYTVVFSSPFCGPDTSNPFDFNRYVPRPFQDCQGAIQLCSRNINFIDTSLNGAGYLTDELGQSSCIVGNETNSVWFTFKAKKAGLVKFVITPFDTAQDFDFTVIRLYGQPNTLDICSQIAPNDSVAASCNFSSSLGATGVWDSTFAGNDGTPGDSTQDGGGTRVNSPFYAGMGETFVLFINMNTVPNSGFNLHFANPDSVTADVGSYQEDIFEVTGVDSLIAPYGATACHWFFNGSQLPDTATEIYAAQSGAYYVSYNAPYCGRVTSHVYIFVKTGISIQNLNQKLVLAPNPTHSAFAVSGKGLTGFVSGKGILYNALGQVMEVKTIQPEEGNINQVWDISHLSEGVYTLEIRTEQGNIRKKVVKQ